MRKAATIAGVLIFLLVGVLSAAAPVRADADQATIARNLAENVLGRGLVRTSRIDDNGRGLTIRWESATFKPANPAPHTREMLQTEAQFAAESIFRVLGSIRDINFEIVQGRRSLASGRASRDRPFRIAFTGDLGR